MPEFPPDKHRPDGNDPDSPAAGRRLRASARPRFRGDTAASDGDRSPQASSRQESTRAVDPADLRNSQTPGLPERSASSASGHSADSAQAPTPRPVAPRTRREARMLRAAAASGASAAGVAAAADSNTPDDPYSQPHDSQDRRTDRRQHRVDDAPRTFSRQDTAASARDDRHDRRGDGTVAGAAAAAEGSAGAGGRADAAADTPTSRRDARERRGNESQRTSSRNSPDHGPGRVRRHSSRLGETFPSLVGWTSLSTLLPGIGLLRTRFRPAGLVVFGLFVLTLLIGLVYLLVKGPVRAIATVISSPSLLNFLAVAGVLVAVIWILVMLASHLGLRRGHRYRPWQNKMAGVLVVSLALIIGIPLGVGSVFARVQSNTVASLFGDSTGKAHTAEELWADKPYINVFLMGRDNGDDREGTRPDTMLVASIDTKTGNAALISVPRNLAFPIFPKGSALEKAWPDGFRPSGDSSEDLINAVWQWGDQNQDKIGNPHGLEPGMWATMQAVEGSLGLNLDYWASVDMAGFEDVVDAIGGVKIDVERPIPMGGGKSLSGVKNQVYGWVDPGPQVLKGKDALWYVRSREGSDNYDRMCRQQRMLKTTLEQIDPQEIATAYPKLANSATRNIATSIPQNEIPAFIELALMMQKGDVTSVQINNDVTPTYDPDYDVLHKWILGEVKGASDGEETPKPTNDASTGSDTDSATASDESTDAADESTKSGQSTDGAEASATATTTPGEPDADGKCYPKGYKPGDDFPGYPGPNGGTGEQG